METKRINYTITFLSDWHAGSGLSSGADADAVVIKDKNNLPYLPGKTIKGLLKDVFEDFREVQPNLIDSGFVKKYFGEYNEKGKISDAGSLFFANAELNENEKNEITEQMSSFLYRNLASTRIDEKGVAEKHSLRTMQVSIPLVLEGYIDGVIDTDIVKFEKALNCIRHLGVNRNRGLGRCKFEIKAN
ncbi:MAG: RAMP superfamily CRISPR-associated protein [Bacteroidales bacterium]|nr:RAMP superfamily CRISPR-associated protein [Bacteroidales bacterium]MDY0215618.1 RAMP superfamily CRISPR-associated protein [Bacteroidales bacterium]